MIHTIREALQGFLHLQQNIRKVKDAGQSTIEFLLTFAFVLATIFVFIKIAMNVTNGYLVHYATYMSSRAFLVNDNASNSPSGGDAKAKTVAKTVFNELVPNLPGTGSGVEVYDGTTSKAVFRGVVATFKQKFAFSNVVGGASEMTYISESFLGREPTQSECAERVCKALNEAIGSSGTSCSEHMTVYDNGC